jgi:hypothetical protein
VQEHDRRAAMTVSLDVQCGRSDGDPEQIGVDVSSCAMAADGGEDARADAPLRQVVFRLHLRCAAIAFTGVGGAPVLLPIARDTPPGSTPRAATAYTIEAQQQMSEQTYDDGRARNLEAMLRALAARISELEQRGELLTHANELMRLIGDVRSELFHYEVRATYDTPEVAENRRIVTDAKKEEATWQSSEWTPDEDDDTEW